MKRTVAMLLALVLSLGILAGCQQEPVETTTAPTTTATTSAPAETTTAPTEAPAYSFEGKTLDMWTQKDLSGYPIIDWIKEDLGLDLTSAIKNESIAAHLTEKVTPSLVFEWGPSNGHKYGRYGSYINLYDYKELLPNFFAKYDSYGDQIKADYETAPGELYSAPIFVNGDYQHYGWFYREDIFEELNLEVPTNWDEFMNVCKVLKEAYPDSYPFTCRNLNVLNMNFFNEFAQQFGVRYRFGYFQLDQETGTYYSPVATDECRTMLEMMRQMIELGYMDVAAISNDTATWQADMTTGKSFITFDKAFQLGTLETAGQEADPDFSISWWNNIPLTDTATNYHCHASKDYGDYSWSITSRCADVELALRYLDWLYTEEATELFCWGKEGVSYEVDADGNKKFIEGFDNSNMAVYYFLGNMDFVASIAVRTPKTQEMILDTMEASKEGQYVDPTLTFNEEEQKVRDTYFTNWEVKKSEYLQRFLLGDLELNDENWEKYKADLLANGEAELIAIYDSAYQRLIAG